MNFGNWLQKELDKRGWNQTELSRRTGIRQGHISTIIKGTRYAGPEPCIAIAEALSLPREQVFRARGWLLSQPDDPYGPTLDPEAVGLAKEVSLLPLESREVTLDLIRAVLKSARQFNDKIQELDTNGHEYQN